GHEVSSDLSRSILLLSPVPKPFLPDNRHGMDKSLEMHLLYDAVQRYVRFPDGPNRELIDPQYMHRNQCLSRSCNIHSYLSPGPLPMSLHHKQRRSHPCPIHMEHRMLSSSYQGN